VLNRNLVIAGSQKKMITVYLVAAIAMALSVLEGHVSIATCNVSCISVLVDKISTDKRVARSFCNSRASCTFGVSFRVAVTSKDGNFKFGAEPKVDHNK